MTGIWWRKWARQLKILSALWAEGKWLADALCLPQRVKTGRTTLKFSVLLWRELFDLGNSKALKIQEYVNGKMNYGNIFRATRRAYSA